MATRAARIPVDDFERGRLPAVCALSGQPADGSYTETLRSPVGNQAWLILVGLVPFLVVRYLTRKEAKGSVPVTRAAFASLEAQARERRWRAGLLVLGGIILGPVGAALAANVSVTLGWVVILLGVGAFVGGMAYDARTPLLRGHVEPSGRWVVFENAHPAFAAAVAEQVRAS
jgi:hypothetical protein